MRTLILWLITCSRVPTGSGKDEKWLKKSKLGKSWNLKNDEISCDYECYIFSLLEDMKQLATERLGGPMLYELIEVRH